MAADGDVATAELFVFHDTFRRDLAGMFVDWQPTAVPDPQLVALNPALAAELGLDPYTLASDAGVAVLAGNRVPVGGAPIAMAYAGHQFGGYSPRLGDGRALLLGELIDVEGRRRDLHLKGSGRTPFARGGDGKAAVGPMLREYVIGEAMHALGVPTTRALAVVATGELIARDSMLPGAVLARVAASHLRVGTFEYAARTGDPALLQRLADYAIARHYPGAANAERPALALLSAVIEAQASLVARWMLVGFIHGVMNTDNMTISGESIDYGPCAFVERFDPTTVYSSIDHGGRYAYGNQPRIAQWNLTRLAETLLPLIDPETDRAVELATAELQAFPDRFRDHWRAGMRAKLGLLAVDADHPDGGHPDDDSLFDDLLKAMYAERVDYTLTFRELASSLRSGVTPAHLLGLEPWLTRWRARLDAEARPAGMVADAVADAMDAVNPINIPRNHLVEQALAAATNGDLDPFEHLLRVVTDPYADRAEWAHYASPADDSFTAGYQTFCGT